MIAYQMIYTACGKDKSGAFSVWAKSNEITKTECDEIIKLMSYRKPKDAPYEPTEEEIKTLFPKKYGYFLLSSGRKCVAQSSYIGQVYSEQDPRSGNFIIHAYVFDGLEDICPFGIVQSNLFKTGLSYKEWHDDPAPNDLPSVELSIKPYFNSEEIKKYLAEPNKINILSSLLQAVISSIGTDKVVTFNSNEEDQKRIYSLLGILLPKQLIEQATFSNQYVMSIEYNLISAGLAPIKIRNVFGGSNSASFNYEEEIAAGNYAFSFDNNLFASLEADHYVSSIIKCLKTGTLFDTLQTVDRINKIMSDIKCSPDVATCIDNFINNKFDWFTSLEEFKSTLNTVVKSNYINKAVFAKTIYNNVLKIRRWGFDSKVKDIIEFVYVNGDETIKDCIIFDVLSNLEMFGVSKEQSPKTFFENIKQSLPFSYDDLLTSIMRSDNVASVFINSKNKCLHFTFFNILISLLQSRISNENTEKTKQELLRMFKEAVLVKNLEIISLYLESINVLGSGAEEWMVRSSIPNLLNTKVSNIEDLKFLFKIILSINNNDTQIKFMEDVIKNNLTSVEFIPVYLSVYEQNVRIFDLIEKRLKQNVQYADFFIKKDAYVFKNTHPITAQALNKYYGEYYVKGYDSGIFLLKFKEYVNSINSINGKIKELIARFDTISQLDNGFCDVIHIIEYIEREVYSIDLNELLKLTSIQIKSLSEINKRLSCVNAGRSANKYNILLTVLLLQGKLGKDVLLTAIENNTVYEKLSLQQLDIFSVNYFYLSIKNYSDLRDSKKIDKERVFVSLIQPVVMGIANYKDYIKEALNIVGVKENYAFMADVMSYGFNRKNQFAEKLKMFIEWYIDLLTRRQYKKLFKKVKGILNESEYFKVEEYINSYLDEHKSFFDKLFGHKEKRER